MVSRVTTYKGKYPDRIESIFSIALAKGAKGYRVRTNSGGIYSVSVIGGELPKLSSELSAWRYPLGTAAYSWEYQSDIRRSAKPSPLMLAAQKAYQDWRNKGEEIHTQDEYERFADFATKVGIDEPESLPLLDAPAPKPVEADNVSGARSIIEGMELKAVATIEAGQKNGAFAGAFFVATVDHVLGEGRMIQHVRTNGSEVGRWKYVSLDQSLDISRSMAFGFVAANLLGRAAGLIE